MYMTATRELSLVGIDPILLSLTINIGIAITTLILCLLYNITQRNCILFYQHCQWVLRILESNCKPCSLQLRCTQFFRTCLATLVQCLLSASLSHLQYHLYSYASHSMQVSLPWLLLGKRLQVNVPLSELQSVGQWVVQKNFLFSSHHLHSSKSQLIMFLQFWLYV